MEPKPNTQWQIRLLALMGLLLLVMAVNPLTGWLVRNQLRLQVAPPSAMVSALRDLGVKEGQEETSEQINRRHEPLYRAAEHFANDPEVAIAYALLRVEKGNSMDKVRNLRELSKRFPVPAVYATILRFAAQGEVGVKRDEEYLLSGDKVPDPSKRLGRAVDPAAAEAFVVDAKAGEQLQPDNAYFPMMKSVALYALHRDAEAMDAIHVAAQKTLFDDYTTVEANGMQKLTGAAYGHQSAINRTMMMASILFPHYAQLRASARMTTYKAIEAEQAGKFDEGIALRYDLMRCGSLMRTQCRSYIGNLVGIAISAIPASRPGGIPADKSRDNLPLEERVARRRAKFMAYLKEKGHEADVAPMMGELEAGQQVRQVTKKGLEDSVFQGPPVYRLGGLWFIDILLLSNLLRLLLLSIVALVLLRKRQEKWAPAGAVLLGIVLAGAIYIPHADWAQSIAKLTQVFFNMSASSENGDNTQSGLSPDMVRFLIVCISLAAPIMLFIGLSIKALVKGKPISETLVWGLAVAGLPLALVFLVAYQGMAMVTARTERVVEIHLDRMQAHGGRYYAELSGEKWPEYAMKVRTP